MNGTDGGDCGNGTGEAEVCWFIGNLRPTHKSTGRGMGGGGFRQYSRSDNGCIRRRWKCVKHSGVRLGFRNRRKITSAQGSFKRGCPNRGVRSDYPQELSCPVPGPCPRHGATILHVVAEPQTFAQPTDHQTSAKQVRGPLTHYNVAPRRNCDAGRTSAARTVRRLGSFSQILFRGIVAL